MMDEFDWGPWVEHDDSGWPQGVEPDEVVWPEMANGDILVPMPALDINWCFPGDPVVRYRRRQWKVSTKERDMMLEILK